MEFKTQETLEHLNRFHYPTFDELPDELVFMDRMVRIINAVHEPLLSQIDSRPFTASMASNYIKKGLCKPSIGKKYSREHICIVMLASTLKLAYKADEVIAVTQAMYGEAETEQEVGAIHNQFAISLNRNMHSLGKPQTGDIMVEFRDRDMLIELVSAAFTAKTASLMVIG